jgi:ribosomal protein L37AE/L43A
MDRGGGRTTLPRLAPMPPTAPTACPFCQARSITSASEKIDASTYWRCETCGQMWNVGRLQTSNRYGYEGR